MKISYAIPVCNELEEVSRLIDFLYEHKRSEDEIVVLLDTPKASQELLDKLHRYSSANWIILKESEFKDHFADWKNQLNSLCTGDYIFQIDADELPTTEMMEVMPLLADQGVDIILVPRSNTVTGLTSEHIQKWGWRIDELQRVNWPDYQWRIYRNSPNIKWKNKVHEVLEGYRTYTALPNDMSAGDLFLHHPKTIERQEKQNSYYNTL